MMVNLLIIGSAIALTVALAFAIAKNAAPRLRYAIAVLAFFAAAIVPLVPRNTSSGGQAILPVRSSGQAGSPVLHVAVKNALPSVPYLPIVWAAVAAALVARELLGHAVLHFRRREWEPASRDLRLALGWPEHIDLFVGDDPPSTIGVFRTAVVIPRNCDPRIARHELAHARWRDPLINAVVRIVRAILWPSVPLWFLERVIRTEREVAADAFAIDGRREAVIDYASMLVTAAAPKHRVATALGNGIGLEERINRLFATKPNATRMSVAAAVLMTGAIATTAVPTMHDAPPAHVMPGRATVEYERAARAMNDILGRTRFQNHDATPNVHQLLGRIRASGTVAPLLDALGARDRRTRESVAWIAGELGDPALVPALIDRLHDPDPHVQETAAWALGMIGDRRAVTPLLAALQSRVSSTRHGAAWALGRMHAAEAAGPLKTLLDDRSRDVRHGAAWALAQIGG